LVTLSFSVQFIPIISPPVTKDCEKKIPPEDTLKGGITPTTKSKKLSREVLCQFSASNKQYGCKSVAAQNP
jgi:hypothetical protein